MKKYLSLIIISFGILVATAYAQSDFNPVSSGVIDQQISGTISPENPTPGQTVTISLSGPGTDLNNTLISWSVNGSTVTSQTGATQFQVQAGENGEVKNVVATISPTDAPTIVKTFTISSQDVSIIYESDGYVPPFYKGKATYGREGTVRLVAMPNLISKGIHLNPRNLIYKWSVNDTVQGSLSGYGKQTFDYTGDILGLDVVVKVDVTSPDGTVGGSGNILLSPQDSQVLIYESNPLYGTMINKELSTNGFNLTDAEATVLAVPYSTSASDATDGITYQWSINGSGIDAPANQDFATFRNSAGQHGTSVIGVAMSNTTDLLQSANNSASINF